MKKFRSVLCLLLAVLMLAVCFAGCSKKTAASSATSASASSSSSSQTAASTASSSSSASASASTSAAKAPDYASMENINVRFAQFGNSLDDTDGYNNDPIRAQIEKDLNITLEYDTGTDGFDDRMQTELYTGAGPDLFPTWGETDKIAKYIKDGLVTDIGKIINASPDRYPTLYKIINSAEYKAYNKLYTGDENSTYAIYSVAAFAEPSFSGISVYNQAILDKVNGGKVPATIDEFMTYCEAAGKAGYVGWWPRNDKLTNWTEIDAELALPQGTSIVAPTTAGTGTILSGELGTDSEKWTITATSDASKAVVKQLAELYKTGGLDANIGVKGDFDDAYADFGNGKLGAVNFGFGYPGQFRDFYNAAWASVKKDATPDDLTVGQALTSNGNYAQIYDTGTWINSHYFIPTSCKNPDRVLDLVEYIASAKGQDLLQNCTNGQFRTDQGSDYWKAIDGAYGYGDGRCKYCWFSYMFSGTEYYVDFTNNDWWTAVSNPTDFSSNWATETDNALVQKARDTVSAYKDKVHIILPSYYNMIALPSEANDIITKLTSITNEYLAQFIGGQLDVDGSWDKYVKAYQDAGAADLETMINEAVATARTNYATK